LRLKSWILKRDHYRCQLCGTDNPRVTLEIDHKVPVARQGTNNPLNLWVLCRPCNQAKGTQEIELLEEVDLP